MEYKVYDASRTMTTRANYIQEVEFQGLISGYVFNAGNRNKTLVEGYETLGAGYVVMAQEMEPDTDATTCSTEKKQEEPQEGCQSGRGLHE